MRYLQKLEKPKETGTIHSNNKFGSREALELGEIVYFSEDEDSSPSDEKPKDKNWMEEAEKRLQLLKLEVEKGNKDDDEDDWSDSDDDDFDDEDDEDDDV